MSADDVEAMEESGDYASIAVLLASSSGSEDAEEIAEACCDGLLRLASSADKEAMGAAAWPAVVRTLEAYSSDSPAVAEVALSVLAKLAPSNQRLFSPSLSAALLAAMSENDEGEPTLQEQACLLVQALAENDRENAEALSKAGFAEELERAGTKIVNERNKAYPLRAAAAIKSAMA